MVGVSFVNLVFFPKFLPFGFGGEWVVKAGEVGNVCGHAGNNNSGGTLVNFAIGERGLMETNRKGRKVHKGRGGK